MSAAKLTKKQLKAAQFRAKGKEVAEASDSLGGDKTERVSEEGGIANAAEEAPLSTSKKEKEEKEEKKRKRKEAKAGKKELKPEDSNDADTKAPKKKRKLEEAAPVDASVQKRTKRRFTEDGKVEEVQIELPAQKSETEAKTADGSSSPTATTTKDDKRYIVFVGNMSFKSTSTDIAKHFSSHCNETPSVRLLTNKGDPSKLAALPKSKQKSIAKGKAADPSAPTSKGCAFVEFKTPSALQKALQFHHTMFEGRNINVELTAGGGGKGNGRKDKIKKKNEDLEAERQKLHEKYVKNAPKKEKEGSDAKKKTEGEKETAAPPTPQWGPRASAAAAKQRATTKIPKWAASGSNAVRLSG